MVAGQPELSHNGILAGWWLHGCHIIAEWWLESQCLFLWVGGWKAMRCAGIVAGQPSFHNLRPELSNGGWKASAFFFGWVAGKPWGVLE